MTVLMVGVSQVESAFSASFERREGVLAVEEENSCLKGAVVRRIWWIRNLSGS